MSASGSLGRCHYFKGKFIASNLCVTPKNPNEIEMKFYANYFNSIRNQIVDDLADETSKLTIDIESLRKYKIKKVDIAQQKSFISALNKQEEMLLKKQKEIEEIKMQITKAIFKMI